jgi:CDP-4-dehydro-6-deoxyglucose reductase
MRARLDACRTGARGRARTRLLDDGLAQAISVPPSRRTICARSMLCSGSCRPTSRSSPSGREFFVEGSETLLKAALRAGLAPNYGCGNGNCGLCKARVVAGEAQLVAPSDYRFSEAEKAQNHVLMCTCTALSSDLVLEVLEAGLPEDIPEQRWSPRCAVDALDGDMMRLHLQTPRSNRLRFLAGQRVTLGIRAGIRDGSDVHGEFPVASCPCDDRNLIFHISRRDRRARAPTFPPASSPAASRSATTFRCGARGAVSCWKRIRSGRWFLSRRRRLRPDQQPDRARHRGRCRRVDHALLGSRTPGGQYLPNQCRAWAAALDEFHYRR